MSSAHGPEILSGSANKKPHGTLGRLLHAREKRHFVLRLGAGSVHELAYFEGDAADDKHQKGVLYLDHSGVSITIHKDHNELQISNASKGSHHGFHHVVQDLMMEFSSLAELEKWNAALTNCLHPQPPVKHAAAPQTQIKQDAAAKVHASPLVATDLSAEISATNELLAAASIAASEINDAVAADNSNCLMHFFYLFASNSA